MKRAWIIIGSVVTVAAVGFGTVNVMSLLAHEEVTDTLEFAADGVTTLDVGNDNGAVEIVGRDDLDEIEVVAEISHGLRRTRHSAAVEGSTLVIRSSCPPLIATWCSVDHRIVVPTGTTVVVNGHNGRTTIRDIDGDVTVDNDNGRIELVRIGGTIRADGDNGRIEGTGLTSSDVAAGSDNGRVSLAFAVAPQSVVATSRNGNVEVVVPDTSNTYQVETDTRHGSIDAAIRTDPTSRRSIIAETHNGDVTVRYPTG